MIKKTKLFFIVLVITTLAGISFTFYKTVIKGDFVVIDSPEEEIVDTSIE